MSAADQARYDRAARMMRRAVGAELTFDDDRDRDRPTSGLVALHVIEAQVQALGRLLLLKNLVTRDELDAALADAMERTAADAVAHVKARLDYMAGVTFDDPP